MIFTKGFIKNGLKYGWKNDQLYRLPCHVNKRQFTFRKLNRIKVGNVDGYYVASRRKTITQIKEILRRINVTVKA